MKLGSIERELLVATQDANAAIMVIDGALGESDQKARLRAAHRLVRKGLVVVSRGWSKNRMPRAQVSWLSLTPLGVDFCDCYYTPLRTGGNIARRKFETETGRELPVRGNWRKPSWPIINHHRARNLHRASTVSPTAP